MLDLRNAKTISIIGGGTAGWFAALMLRQMRAEHIQVQVIESPAIGIVGVGEGGLINLITTLNRLNLPTGEFIRETGAALKWGFCYEGWRTGTREDTFYAQKYFNAFPLLMDGIAPGYGTVTDYCDSCYSVRTFERFMLHFALVEMSRGRRYNVLKFITKTALFDSLIQILPHKESK